MSRRRIAVVGSGVAGLSAAYVLQREADVTLFEADTRLGGHADTHELTDGAGRSVAVDTGFIVHNERTYPTLLRLFAELDVATQESEMSMSIRCRGCGLEYAGGRGLSGLIPSVRTAVRPRYLELLRAVPRFHRQARAMLVDPGHVGATETMAEFLDRGRFSGYFRSHFAAPLISAVWSCAPQLALEYPARYLFRFLDQHGMLSVNGSPQWRTVAGGSERYVEKAAKQLSGVRISTAVRAVTRAGHGVEIRPESDELLHFDAAVVATHPHQALAMLANPSIAQRELLGRIHYSANPAILHSDASILPRSRRARACWNYVLPDCSALSSSVQISYDMNRLQRLDTDTPYVVTLNDTGAVDPALIVESMNYEHPVYTPSSVAAQARLAEISDNTLAFAGAYHGWGFHEDGCRSGVEAAARLGVDW
jgi:predicted NAD/FAD-binding protein